MNHNNQLALEQSKNASHTRVKNIGDFLYFNKMVSPTQGPQLENSPFCSILTDCADICPG